MKKDGWKKSNETGGTVTTAKRRHAFLACLAAGLLVAGCASDGASEKPQQSAAQQELDESSKELSKPLFASTVEEGSALGGLLGAGLSIGDNRRGGITIPMGIMAGNLAGKYVAAKQEEYTDEVEVIEAMTRDLKTKNDEAARTVKAMEIVVAEHRAAVAEMKAAKAKGAASADRLEGEMELASKDLETMKSAVKKAEEHLSTFTDARDMVLKESETRGLADRPETKAMNGEIDALRARIGAMNRLVEDLASVG